MLEEPSLEFSEEFQYVLSDQGLIKIHYVHSGYTVRITRIWRGPLGPQIAQGSAEALAPTETPKCVMDFVLCFVGFVNIPVYIPLHSNERVVYNRLSNYG